VSPLAHPRLLAMAKQAWLLSVLIGLAELVAGQDCSGEGTTWGKGIGPPPAGCSGGSSGVTTGSTAGSTTPGTKCNTDGSSYEYAETVSGSTRTVQFNVCPNHYFDDGKLNPNTAVAGSETYKMPSSPMLESSATSDVSGQGGSVGVLFDGSYVFSAFAGKVKLEGYSSSATALEGDTFEKCGCHSSSSSSAGYHCHVPPSCLLHQLGEVTTSHSPQIGWAPDGFPIYGPRGPNGGTKIKLCSESTNTDTTYCLDECSGLQMELPSVDNFKYRYYFTGEDYLDGSCSSTGPLSCSDPISPLSTAPYYPFTPKCYKGCCPSGATCSGSRTTIPSCSNSATAGTASGYTAAAKYPTGLPIYTGTVTGQVNSASFMSTPTLLAASVATVFL